MLSLTKSKVFLYFCLSFIVGISVASFFAISDIVLMVFLLILIIISSVFWRERKVAMVAVCLIIVLFGIYRYQTFSGINATSSDLMFDQQLLEKKINFRGVIDSSPDQKVNSVYYETEVRNIDGKDISGVKILAILPLESKFSYGDLVEFEGKIKIPPEDDKFSWRKYLASKGISYMASYPKTKLLAHGALCLHSEDGAEEDLWQCRKYDFFSTVYSLRSRMIDVINKSVSEPEASLGSAILFGNDNAVPGDLVSKFNATGTRHIMAVSGQNITLLIMIIANFVLALGSTRRMAFYIAFISIVFYIILIGMPASAVRAGVMGSLVLIAERMGRLSASWRALIFAATIMLFIDPKLLLFDTGFALSFAATAGIIFIYPYLLEKLHRIPSAFEIRSSLAMTLAAMATTLPISILSFNQFSVISPLANILIVPLVPLVMILEFIIIVVGAIMPAISQLVGWLVWLVLFYEVKTVETLGSFSFSLINIENVNTYFGFVYYLILAIIVSKIRRRKKAPAEIEI